MKLVIERTSKVIAVIFTALAILYPCYASAATQAVPESLKVPAKETLSMEAQGIGVQIYECRQDKNDPSKFGWVFKAPEADLFDSAQKKIGRHYAGPTWESVDGSKVIGEVQEIYKSPDKNSIPWLLLKAKSNSGPGVLSHVSSIQRINTTGGVAPSDGCGKDQAGSERRMPYQATYNFYVSQP